jgi:hypothetical protein
MTAISLLPHGVRRFRTATARPETPSLGRVRQSAPATLLPGERVLLRSQLDSGVPAIATQSAIHLNAVDGAWARVEWADVDRVGWDRVSGRTVIRLWPGAARTDEPIAVRAGRRFADFAAERVANSQVLRRRVTLARDCTATVVALRNGEGGNLRWQLHLDRPELANDPVTRRTADAFLAGMPAGV